MPKYFGWLLIALIVILFGIVGNSDLEEESASEKAYCEEVLEFRQSKGNSGHPDYKGIFSSVCVDVLARK